jgi:peptidoglycan/xylan/chitin deacetylase (PgdA/CDA1 family)
LKKTKIILAGFLHYTGVFLVLNRLMGKNHAVILSFHRTVAEPAEAEKTPTLPYLTVGNFEKLIAYLKNKYPILSLEDWLSGQRKTSGVILTFDDGWQDNYLLAFPVLKKHRVPATIFVAASFIGTQKEFWQVKLFRQLQKLSLVEIQSWPDSELKKRITGIFKAGFSPDTYRLLVRYLKSKPKKELESLLEPLLSRDSQQPEPAGLGWEEIKEMRQSGIDFGSHTLNHIILTVENDETVVKELRLSKQILEEHLGQPVRYFAYPSGEYDERAKALVRQAGYIAAFSTKEDVNTCWTNPLELRRIEMEENKLTDSIGEFCRHLFELETCWLYLKIRNRLKPPRSSY